MVSWSPGREKLPAPGLSWFLAGRGSWSRGRHFASAARSSPLFCARNKSVGRSSIASQAAIATGEVGEPSSPKVTCIGQVRICSEKTSEVPPKEMRPCGQCFRRDLLCSFFPSAKKSKGGERRSLWRRWVSGGRSCRYQRQEQESPRGPPLEFVVIREAEEAATPLPPSPPKNALLLMRCRSAPHNGVSSLATVARGTVSLLPEHEPLASRTVEKGLGEARKKKETKGNWSERPAATDEEEEEGRGSESQRSLVLTRSQSEPARRRRAA